MNTNDIAGAKADTTRLGNFANMDRRADQVRVPHSNDDILGSGPSTLRKSIKTVRMSNPLQPDYQMPGRHAHDSLKLGDPYKDNSSLVNKS